MDTATNTNKSHIIYNLFPRLIRTIDTWKEHLERIKRMQFNSIYINPFHKTGGSRSLYAVNDYYQLNSDFLPKGYNPSDFSILKEFLSECKYSDIAVFMDLVINHTANDSVLIQEHPNWFKYQNGSIIHPYAIDPADPSHVTVWGDLSEINYDNNPDFEGLRNYWDELIKFYQEIGFTGFRCDAAYKVPCSMWHPLINNAKQRNAETLFLAESLGCTLQQVEALKGCGFDYMFNSSKWWNFDGSWCIDQHWQIKPIAPSISFPESHDTPRVAANPPGTINWQKNRYLLASLFSQGLMMPIGFEYGATRALHVIDSCPEHLQEKKWDLQTWITEVNNLKSKNSCLRDEGQWLVLYGFDSDILFLMKESNDRSNKVGLLVNKNWYNGTIVANFRIPEKIREMPNRIYPFNDPKILLKNEGDIAVGPSEMVMFTN